MFDWRDMFIAFSCGALTLAGIITASQGRWQEAIIDVILVALLMMNVYYTAKRKTRRTKDE